MEAASYKKRSVDLDQAFRDKYPIQKMNTDENEEGEDMIEIKVGMSEKMDITDSDAEDGAKGSPRMEVVRKKMLDLKWSVGKPDQDLGDYPVESLEMSEMKDIYLKNVVKRLDFYNGIDNNDVIWYSCAIDSFTTSLLHTIQNLKEDDRNALFGIQKNPMESPENMAGITKLALGLENDLDNFKDIVGEYPTRWGGNSGNLFENSFYCRVFENYNPDLSEEERREINRDNIIKGRNYIGVLMNFMRYYYTIKMYSLAKIDKNMKEKVNNIFDISEAQWSHLKGFPIIRYFWIYYYHLCLSVEKSVRYYNSATFRSESSRYDVPGFKGITCSYVESMPHHYPTITCTYSRKFYRELYIFRDMSRNALIFDGSFRQYPRNHQPSYLPKKLADVIEITKPKLDRKARFSGRVPEKKYNDVDSRKILSIFLTGSYSKSKNLRDYATIEGNKDLNVKNPFMNFTELASYDFYTDKKNGFYNKNSIKGVSKNLLENFTLRQYNKLGKMFQLVNNLITYNLYYWTMEDIQHPITKKYYRPVTIILNENKSHFISLLRHFKTDEYGKITSDNWRIYDNMLSVEGYNGQIWDDYVQTTHMYNPITNQNQQGVVIKDTSLFKNYDLISRKPIGELLEEQKVWTPGHRNGILNSKYALSSVFYIEVEIIEVDVDRK